MTIPTVQFSSTPRHFPSLRRIISPITFLSYTPTYWSARGIWRWTYAIVKNGRFRN